MSYVIVIDATNLIVNTRAYGKDRYATLPAAKAGATRLIKKGMLSSGTYTIYEYSKMPKRTVMVTNLMTGTEVEEDVNLPYCCSVASESYWSN
jgi:hypothetical protein